MNASGKRSIWRAWLPALCWLGIIACESTGAFSAQNTGRFLFPVFHFFFGLDPVQFKTWHFILRKTGHVIGYGTLSVLLFRAWRGTLQVSGSPGWAWVWTVDAILMTALVASLDEWHQTFLPSRTGTVRDVVLDSAAGVAAQIVVYAWLRGWRATSSGCQGDRSTAEGESKQGA